ncbi:MAG: hypothetical protein P9L92_03490 [Candidatus Electryonea clarkiae]|nr:hypothetical protein [Candidatus Electryonea clarkiae]
MSESSESAKDHLVFPLFIKLFGHKFKKETDAQGADIYIEGKLVVELKTDYGDFISGFYQALHYEKKGLTFSAICVITNKFIGLWKLNDIPTFAKKAAALSNPYKSASEIGKTNAHKTSKVKQTKILKSANFCLRSLDFEGLFQQDNKIVLSEFLQVLKNLDSERLQINTFNFINKIEILKKYFDKPIDAIHCFYAIVGYWDITSTVADVGETDNVQIVGYKGRRTSEAFYVSPEIKDDFKKFVENHYIFTNEGSGLSVDYYFSRFDEVISRLNPEYAKQHGIFFTDSNLSKFALWFVHTYYERKLSDKYIVFDPAGGSGNLVTSWRNHIKHKIVSELQPDLLKTIERRMRLDPDHKKMGFTIIPKTSENRGLNFLDKSAEEYVYELMQELRKKNLKLDKPLAFLVNPPYKNTDESEKQRKDVDAIYPIHNSIIRLTGKDAGKERYLAFLGQIINIARLQTGDLKLESDELDFNQVTIPPTLNEDVDKPLLLIFTPTSWLIPRISYKIFRGTFDKYFKFENGFIFLGREFFKIKGKFPIAFTIWRYNKNNDGNNNIIKLKDLTHLSASTLNINWNQKFTDINKHLKPIIRNASTINFSKKKNSIYFWLGQRRLDFTRSPTSAELLSNKIYGGLPINDPRRENIKTYGIENSDFIGFMDDNTPVRIKRDRHGRMSKKCDRVWFRLDSDIKGANKTRITSVPPDNRGYAAYDQESSQKTFVWYAISKALIGNYPIWANQLDLWKPNITKSIGDYFYSLCYAYGLAENFCVVTKYEADNPVPDTPEVFIDNPMCPANPESFWSLILDREIEKSNIKSFRLMMAVKELYEYWNNEYCKAQFLFKVGLKEEPYFKYFNYPDFLTPFSGLIQIRKYAEVNCKSDLSEHFERISRCTREVRKEIYSILIDNFKYFS